ncbi:transcriptional regulator with XRE-family HTH domain [Blastomonas natatoria]|uniref:Transcriptional regulator with XRE-family HTH domain n=1 Tax=Blastomonas natatoria TaxID=34015 RepID=A0A2V3VBG4_9SPHN|nr:helix-turn-helix domain-containing protein [Blastomonas natatoria]PXW79027.1 transcriptional regulator with XRE-family HTH domain [Blastomonas natatoria]
MSVLETIGQRIRDERLRLGLGLADFSEKAGVHKNSQSAYEAGRTSCNAVYLAILGDLGVDLSYVFTGKRSDGTLGFQEQSLLTMLNALSLREREAIYSAVSVLAGNVVDLGSYGHGKTARAPSKLNSEKIGFLPEPSDQ